MAEQTNVSTSSHPIVEGATLPSDALLQTTDAVIWAKEFVARFGGDEGLMLGWFANAIERGRTAGQADTPARIDITLWPRTGGARVHEHAATDGSDGPTEWTAGGRIRD